MLQRTLTGAVILLFTVAFVLLKQVHALFFDAFVLIVMYASILEISNAYKTSNKTANNKVLLFVPALMCLVFNLAKSPYPALVFNALIAVAFLVTLLTYDIIVFAYNRKHDLTEKNVSVLNQSLFEKTRVSMLIYAYPLLPLSFMFALNHLPYEIGYVGIILIFAVSMLTDTFAYFFGFLFGKHKFIPEVSPKKTVEGVVGGFIGGIIGALACYFIFYYTDLFVVLNIAGKTKSIIAFLIIGVIGSYINQLGDLIASALKRKIGIKDYANIFPGHGGFMDRVDGMMFVSTFIYIILTLFFV